MNNKQKIEGEKIMNINQEKKNNLEMDKINKYFNYKCKEGIKMGKKKKNN